MAPVGITPTFVSSGYGLHAYIVLSRDIPVAEWQSGANALAAWCGVEGVAADHGITKDAVRILRAPGTRNHKDPLRPQPVRLLGSIQPNDAGLVLTVLARHGLDASPRTPPKQAQDFSPLTPGSPTTFKPDPILGDMRGPQAPSSAAVVAESCAQLAAMRDAKEAVSGTWYPLLGVLAFCEDGEALAQEWSSAHPTYSEAETSEKLARWRSQVSGAVTCATLDGARPGICGTCMRRGTITSPVQLGREQQATTTKAIKEGLPALPSPFAWDKLQRLIKPAKVDDEAAMDVVISDRPLYMARLTRNELSGHLACVFRHRSTTRSWEEFTISAPALAGKNARQVFAEHIPQFHNNAWAAFQQFYISSQNMLEKRGETVSYDQFGFKPGTARRAEDIKSFVLGDIEYFADGTHKPAALSESLRVLAKQMVPKGTLEQWTNFAGKICLNGMEGHTYAFAAGFAALLMNLSGEGAPILHTYSTESGTGKTAVGLAIGSIFGDKRATVTTSEDTHNARMIQLARHCHIPLYWDELRERDSLVVEKLIMQLSIGRDKRRATQTGGLVENEAEWSTIVFSSSNASIRDLIGISAGGGDDAAAARVFEYVLSGNPYSVSDFMAVVRGLQANAGHAGPAFLQAVLPRLPAVQRAIDQRIEYYQKSLKAQAHHRYLLRIHATVEISLRIAVAIGLLEVSPDRIVDWGTATLRALMDDRSAIVVEPSAALGEYFMDNIHAAVVVSDPYRKGYPQIALKLPQAQKGCHIRVEVKANIIYVDQQHMRRWLIKNRYDPRTVFQLLADEGVFVGEAPLTPRLITLTAGVVELVGAPVRALALNGNHANVEGISAEIIKLGESVRHG